MTCCDELALIGVVQHGLEEGVGKKAAAAVEGGEVPHDAAAITAGGHALLTRAGLHPDAVHCPLVLLHHMPTIHWHSSDWKCSAIRVTSSHLH